MGGALPTLVFAQAAPPVGADTSVHSAALFVMLVSGALLLPFVVLIGTSFVKISVVLTIIRSAIGVSQLPSTIVIVGLSAVLTLFIMSPTINAVASSAGPHFEAAMRPAATPADTAREIGAAWDAARTPIQRFLRANTAAREQATFVDLARQSRRQ